MQYLFSGRISSKKKELLEEALNFFVERLLPADIIAELEVDIDIMSKNYENLGMLINEDMENEETQDRRDHPRYFTIMLRNTDPTEMIKTLAHEVVHLKQHVLGELRYIRYNTKGCSWDEGKEIPTWYGNYWVPEPGDCVEHDSPWEVEAYGKEIGLITKFAKHWKELNEE